MLNAVIAMSSDDMSSILKDRLNSVFSVICCHDGVTALRLLQDLRPEILIVDLSLPELDGITLLEQCNPRPAIILAIIDLDNDYVRDAAQDVGIGYIIKSPADVNTLVTRVLDMVHRYNKTARRQTTGTQSGQILLELGFAMHLNGCTYLQAALPMYADDPSLQMKKELYESIAAMFHASDYRAVERSIRSAIHDAWERRDARIWEKYFPGNTVTKETGPSNKQFISRIAEELNRRN